MNGRQGGAEPGTVDWGLLADYLGGALAGTEDEARVAGLVAADPAWAAAAGELSSALDLVAADLRTLPEPDAMPADVIARLDAALATTALATTAFTTTAFAATPLATTAQPTDPASEAPPPRSQHSYGPGGPASVSPPATAAGGPVNGRGRGKRRPPARPERGRRHRRVVRWGGSIAVAAGLMAFAALGLSNLLPERSEQFSGEEAPGAMSQGDDPLRVTGDPALLASGLDYQPGSFGGSAAPGNPGITGNLTPEPATEGVPDQAGPGAPGSVPAELEGLWHDPHTRTACLSTVVAAFQPAVISIESIDFARFQGEPALVMSISVAGGGNWVWVTGPACGAAGPDLRHQEELG